MASGASHACKHVDEEAGEDRIVLFRVMATTHQLLTDKCSFRARFLPNKDAGGTSAPCSERGTNLATQREI